MGSKKREGQRKGYFLTFLSLLTSQAIINFLSYLYLLALWPFSILRRPLRFFLASFLFFSLCSFFIPVCFCNPSTLHSPPIGAPWLLLDILPLDHHRLSPPAFGHAKIVIPPRPLSLFRLIKKQINEKRGTAKQEERTSHMHLSLDIR